MTSNANPEISVIITAFEQRVSLPMLLKALARQQCSVSFEILVCDDGSSPRLMELASAVTTREQLDLRYIWQQKKGPRAARSKNNGIRAARGELLVFLDADILVHPTFLGAHWNLHQSSPKQIICNPRKWFFPGGALTATNRPTKSSVVEGLRHLSELIVHDPDGAFEHLDACSEEVDRRFQRDYFRSDAPWKAFVGFSFSVRNNRVVRFDETFEGWGPEDRELAVRLVTQHGFEVQFNETIEVYHIEACSTGRTPYAHSPVLPDQIRAYLRNMLYFVDKYPDESILPLCKAFLLYELDETRQNWRPTPQPILTGPDVEEMIRRKIADVRQWFEDRRAIKCVNQP